MKKLFLLFALAFVAVSCEEGQDYIDNKGHGLVFLEGEMKAYFPDKGDTKNYKFNADLAWSATVSADWVEVNPTSGEVGENKIQIKVDKNKRDERRTGYVDITLSNDKSYRIELEQMAAGENLDDIIKPTTPIPNNEIWYTTIDGEIVEPNDPMAFNVSIKSNIYEDGKGVITFDGEVTEVGELAFYGCDNCTTNCYNLTSFIFPQSVTSIGNLAFYGCRNLQSVTISDNVTHIGYAAFICCTRLKEFNSKFASEDGRCLIIDGVLNTFAPAGLAEYTIPDSVTTIGNWAFEGCSSLISVTIPDSVTTIEYAAFHDCSSLTSVTIGDSVTTIGEWAFSGCSSLTSAIIPDSVTTIGDGAFYRCSSLTSIIIPDSVTTIGNWAFEGCSSLISVTIPDSVTSIGDGAFFGCTGELVVNCNIPDASYFDSSTFYGSQFTSVTIGDSVTTIGSFAFSFCSSLTSVTIGDSVTTIRDGVFFGCDSLAKFNGKFVSEDGRCLIVDDTLMSFAIGCGATEYVIPPSVTVIGHYAFYRCFSLTSVTIPDSVTTIGHQSFNQCTGLTSVVIPDSVTIIYGYAFSGCNSLTSVTIPDSVTTIGNAIFGHCSNLTEFNGKFASEDGRCLLFNGILNSFAPAGLTEYTIPDSVTAIGWNAFSYCDSLTSVTIPDSVIAIGYEAFYNCSSLTSVYCKAITPPTAEVYDNYWRAFDENAYSPKIYVPIESVKAYKSANYWGNYADAIVGYNFETGEVDDTEIGEEPEEPE